MRIRERKYDRYWEPEMKSERKTRYPMVENWVGGAVLVFGCFDSLLQHLQKKINFRYEKFSKKINFFSLSKFFRIK